ncbi:MAG: hypothetical protein AAFV29_05425, partial [Myxococcota bacterium]
MARTQSNRELDLEKLYGGDLQPKPRLGLIGFLVPVVLVAALGAGALFLYKQKVDIDEEIARRAIAARDKTKKFDLPSLQAAEKLYREIVELDPGNGMALSNLALVNFAMSQHGLPTRSEAQKYFDQAVAAGAASPVRFAVGAYLDITDGNAAKAENEMTLLLEQQRGAPIIAHALGWAKAQQGAYIEGNRVLRQAVETDFSAVAYRLTLAEYAHRNGDLRGAVKQLASAYRSNASPDLQLAKAWAAALRLQVYGAFETPLKLIKSVQDAAKKADQVGRRTSGLLKWAEGEL